MKFLVIGNGGREHALAWKLSLSPLVTKIYCLPGNGGTKDVAENVNLDPLNNETIADFAAKNQIDLTVVGPEAYLASGIVDLFRKRGLPIYGPTMQAARLESSKAYAKDFMKKYGIPTAQYRTFTDPAPAREYIAEKGTPIVVKADGLAAGKGVAVAFDRETAFKAVDDTMTGRVFGEAGNSVVIEEYLEGEEVSLLAFCDGKTAVPMLPVQDHKRIGDGDTGPNTGGMGTYAPATVFSEGMAERIKQEILEPTMRAMEKEGSPFVGILFLGLMITKNGPKLVEYNVRFGDPETQVVLPLLESDLATVFLEAVHGRLSPDLVRWKHGTTAVCVVAASAGYPGPYQKGREITGLEQIKESLVFHAGTGVDRDRRLVTTGGRVLNLVHLGANIREAVAGVYRDISKLRFEGIYYRRDIGHRELERSAAGQ
ncbi:MAG: phosphoribosylamine--glycine ligase [Bacillota bacterium]